MDTQDKVFAALICILVAGIVLPIAIVACFIAWTLAFEVIGMVL